MQFMRGMVIRQSLRMESHTANPARKVTVCSQMGTEYPETQVSGDTELERQWPYCAPQAASAGVPSMVTHGQSLLPPSNHHKKPCFSHLSPDSCRCPRGTLRPVGTLARLHTQHLFLPSVHSMWPILHKTVIIFGHHTHYDASWKHYSTT